MMLPEARPVHALLLDFDGTLTFPGALDFAVIRGRIGCPPQKPVLEFIESIEDPHKRETACKALDDFERQGAAKSKPNPGAERIVLYARKIGLKVGILTRNTLECVQLALENFSRLTMDDFDLVLTRDDQIAPKPAPDGIREAARRWNIPVRQIMVVGDFWFDTESGRRAGCLTTWLDVGTVPGKQRSLIKCDYHITRLDQLLPIIERHRPLSAGKLPARLLADLLSEFKMPAPELIVPPGPGQDTAVVELGNNLLVVLKADPITFATEQVGRYTVAVNANDIATAGAKPRWMLATVLLPEGITPGQVHELFASLHAACQQENIILCGGHTEVTDAVTRPIVSAAMLGTVAPDRLVTKNRMEPGDVILVTKKAAVEATALIARQFANLLIKRGVDKQIIDEAATYLEKISIMPEAQIAAASGQVSAMHDVTEGGIATAIDEFATAGGCRLRIDLDKIPVYRATTIFCKALDLDPLGLIGSGSLLIACKPEYSPRLIKDLGAADIPATVIGTATAKGTGIDARQAGRPAPWPSFEVDEITRLYTGNYT